MQECEDPPDLQGVTGKPILEALTAWGHAYRVCADMHKALIRAVKPP